MIRCLRSAGQCSSAANSLMGRTAAGRLLLCMACRSKVPSYTEGLSTARVPGSCRSFLAENPQVIPGRKPTGHSWQKTHRSFLAENPHPHSLVGEAEVQAAIHELPVWGTANTAAQASAAPDDRMVEPESREEQVAEPKKGRARAGHPKGNACHEVQGVQGHKRCRKHLLGREGCLGGGCVFCSLVQL